MVTPFAPDEAWSVLSPEDDPAPALPRWMRAASAHLGAELSLLERADHHLVVGVAPAREPARVTMVRVRTMSPAEAPAVMAAAHAGVEALGGAGMDALVARARRVWQASRATDGDARAPLVLAAAWALALLGPVVPPDERVVFGVRGARERLARMGW